MPTTDNISFNDNNSLDDNYTLEDIDLNSNNNDTINNKDDDDDKKYTHRFDLLGDIEEGNENIDNFNSDSYSKQTRNTNNNNNNSNSFDTGSRRQSITSSFKSNLNSIISHGSKNRRGSTSNNNNNHSLRKRRDSSFDYSPFMHSNNNNDTYESSHLSSSAHSTSSSYQNRNTDDREKNSYYNDRDTKANTAFNNRTFHFEVIPSEMPDFSTTDTSSSTSNNTNKSSNNNNDDTSSSIITSNNSSSSDLNKNGREPIPNQHILLKPKQIHQNPLTPQVLPQGFTPINKWSRYKAKYHKEWLAEFLGTFILISLGDGCSIQNLLNQQSKINDYNELIENLKTSGNSSLTSNNGDVVSIVGNMLSGVTKITQNYNISVQLAWAGSVVAAFFAAGGSSISGAHLSWCITLINFLFRGSPKFKLFFPYLIAQLLGAYVAGLTLFGLYHSVIEEVFPNWRTSSDFTSMFVTVPLDYLSTERQFVSEFMGSFYLVIGIFAMTDPYNNTSPEVFPVYLFFFIFTLNASMSLQTGAALNFSRDLGPRLALWTVGVHHSLLFDSNHHYFWIPMVAPLLGGLLGAFTYDLLIFRGQESWVNKPWYQNRANLKKRFKKVKKFLKKILLIKKFRKNSYYNDRGKNRKKNRSYNIGSSDEDIDINDSKFDESDEIYGGHNVNADDDDESEERRDKNNINGGVRFVDDNASLTTTASSDINPDNFDEILHRNNKRRGSITNSTGAYSLNNIPEEEFSLEEEEQEEEIEDSENYNNHGNLNFNYYDNTLSKPKNVFRSYNNVNLRPHESNASKKKKEISFKSNKHTRKFVPTVEKEEKM